jgi:hypothetical protein
VTIRLAFFVQAIIDWFCENKENFPNQKGKSRIYRRQTKKKINRN